MPKFLITILLINTLTWFQTIKILNTVPETLNTVFTFLALAGTSTALTLSLIIFFILNRKEIQTPNTKLVYRRSLKMAFLITLGPVVFLALKATQLDNTINLILLGTLYVMILFRLGKHQRK